VQRFRKLAVYITQTLNPALLATVDRAATLAKADLDTQMVGEFSELQGVMGREYALIAGENPVVAKAIYEHYLPTAAGGELPSTEEGSIVSIADKMDTIAGFFGVNLIPTGTADPYALRRQALGIVNIILNKNYPLSLEGLVDESLNILNDRLRKPRAQVKVEVLEFFKARFENQLISQGHPYDVVDSVLATGISDITRTFKKIEAMESFKNHADYGPLAVAFKRAGNIIKDFQGGSIDPALFESVEEKNLFDAFQALKQKAATYIENDDYQGALMEMALLRKPVDAFFESVLVMAKDEKIRCNRLAILEEISSFFRRIADFSKIVTEGKA
jgi:glycyl-tRNA synthetase beta chain